MPAEKRAPVGICDQCGGKMHPNEHYTSKGKPRLHCSIECRQTANSRAGAKERSRKAKERVARGEWVNPRDTMSDDEISAVQSTASRKARLNEVAEGRWRNPALDDKARRKLSRPRKHRGALARAIEKLRVGSMKTLTNEEHQAFLRYQRRNRVRRRDALNATARQRYAERQAALTSRQRAAQRAKWRKQNKTRAAKSR